MINIDFLTIKAFFLENIDFIINARIQKIQQPTRKDFLFSLRNNGESRKLYININPQIYHLCFLDSNTEKKRNLKIPKHPPMFCMLLRKYLEGVKIQDAKVIDNERILEFYFETIDEFSQMRSLCLCIELMGKHSNIILYDKITNIIIGCAHNVGSEKSRYRELKGGLKYILPPQKEFSLSNELELQFKNLSQEKISKYLNTENFSPAIINDKYTLFQELLPNSILQENVNRMLDNYYSTIQENINLKQEKSKLYNFVEKKLVKVKNSINKINSLLKKRDNTEKYKLYGELLTANIYQKTDYQKNIEVYDYINNKNITIELDNTMSLKENAQRYYKLYSKSKATKEKSLEMLNNLNIEKEYYENILYSIEIALNLDDLLEIKNELKIDIENSKNKIEKINNSNLMYFEIGNFQFYVGKNNKQNDYIISKFAKDDDIWFHTKSCAGSHVLLKYNGIEPSEEIIFEGCKLARKYSSASLPSKVAVIYTKAKYLRKPPASPLGYVTYKNEKEILI